MALALIIFVIILILQILIASYSVLITRDIDVRFAYPLGSMTEATQVLELYTRIYRPVDLRVNADIPTPAYAMEEFILINRDRMYEFDLFTTFFTVFQLELSRKKYAFARNVIGYLKMMFFVEIVLLLIGLIIEADWRVYFIISAIISACATLLLSVIAYFSYESILKKSVIVASDLLDLDDVEVARAEGLVDDLAYHVFDYPIVIFSRVVKFFLPFL